MLPLGHIHGVRLGAHWSLLVALVAAGVVFGAIGGLILALSLFASVLLHELAHALAAVRRGVRVHGVELGITGGTTKIEPAPQHELAIAVAGPIATAVIVMIALVLFVTTRSALALWLLIANGVLFISNALPILPLDGGRAVRAFLSRRMDRVRATEITFWLNRVISMLTLLCASAIAYLSSWLLALPMLMIAGAMWLLGALEVRRVQAQAMRAAMGIEDYDAPWLRR